MKKTCLMLTFLVTIFASLGFAQEREVKISDLKSPKGRDFLNQTVKVNGFTVIYPDSTTFLVDDLNLLTVNMPMPSNRYLMLETNGQRGITQEKYHATFVSVTGKVTLSRDKGDLETAKMLGEESLVQLQITSIKVLKEREPSAEIPRYLNEKDMQKVTKPDAKSLSLVSKCKRYAILYSGGDTPANARPSYWNDIQYIYQVLKNKGYTDDDIVVIYKDGVSPNANYPVDYAASPSGWSNAVTFLTSRMNAKGKGSLFFFMTNHGSGYFDPAKARYNPLNFPLGFSGGWADNDGDESVSPHNSVDLYNRDEVIPYYNLSVYIRDDQIKTWINSIPFTFLYGVFEPCFSGGLIWDLRGPNRLLMASANEFESSWGGTLYNDFVMYFTDAFNRKSIQYNTSVNADTNKDCVISFIEAFNYAKLKTNSSYAQIDADGDGIPNNPNDFNSGNITLGCLELRCKLSPPFPPPPPPKN